MIENLMAWLIENPTASFEATSTVPNQPISDGVDLKKEKRAA